MPLRSLHRQARCSENNRDLYHGFISQGEQFLSHVVCQCWVGGVAEGGEARWRWREGGDKEADGGQWGAALEVAADTPPRVDTPRAGSFLPSPALPNNEMAPTF